MCTVEAPRLLDDSTLTVSPSIPSTRLMMRCVGFRGLSVSTTSPAPQRRLVALCEQSREGALLVGSAGTAGWAWGLVLSKHSY